LELGTPEHQKSFSSIAFSSEVVAGSDSSRTDRALSSRQLAWTGDCGDAAPAALRVGPSAALDEISFEADMLAVFRKTPSGGRFVYGSKTGQNHLLFAGIA
jgi:hypothetical protein